MLRREDASSACRHAVNLFALRRAHHGGIRPARSERAEEEGAAGGGGEGARSSRDRCLFRQEETCVRNNFGISFHLPRGDVLIRSRLIN